MKNNLVLVNKEYGINHKLLPFVDNSYSIFYSIKYDHVFVGNYSISIQKDILNDKL